MLTVTQKTVVSGANAVIAVIAAVPLGLALRPAVAKFMPKKHEARNGNGNIKH